MRRTGTKINLDQDLLEWVRSEAARRRCSVSQVIRELVFQAMNAAAGS